MSITQIEGEDPEIGEIEGNIVIKWKYIEIPLIGKVPIYPDKFELHLSIPVSDNAGLDRLSVWVDGKRMNDIPLYGVKSKTVKTTYKASAFKAIFNGYDVKAKIYDVNGNHKEGKAHVDGALEGLISLLLAFIIAVIMLALAFLGAWVIPVIMAACAVTIGISIAVIVGRLGTYTKNVGDAFRGETENAMENGNANGDTIVEALFDPTMTMAFITLSIAISILFLCLQAYTSIGSWVIDNAVSMATGLVITAFLTYAAMEFTHAQKGEKPKSDMIMGVINEHVHCPIWVPIILGALSGIIGHILNKIYGDSLLGVYLAIVGLALFGVSVGFKDNDDMRFGCALGGLFVSSIAFFSSAWALVKTQMEGGLSKTQKRGKEILNSLGIGIAMVGIGLSIQELDGLQ